MKAWVIAVTVLLAGCASSRLPPDGTPSITRVQSTPFVGNQEYVIYSGDIAAVTTSGWTRQRERLQVFELTPGTFDAALALIRQIGPTIPRVDYATIDVLQCIDCGSYWVKADPPIDELSIGDADFRSPEYRLLLEEIDKLVPDVPIED
jgi:hypothetical protein